MEKPMRGVALLAFLTLISTAAPISLLPTNLPGNNNTMTQDHHKVNMSVESNDKEKFWEVTQEPESLLKHLKSSTPMAHDYVDGNHPNLSGIVTHEQVADSFAESRQTKRVKKILPPYNHTKEISDKPESLVGSVGSGPLRPAKVEELTITEIRNPEGEISHPEKIEIEGSDTSIQVKWIAEGLTGMKVDASSVNNEKEQENFSSKYPDNVTRNVFISPTPFPDFNMQNTSHVGAPENETTKEILDATTAVDSILVENSSGGTEEFDVAPDLKFQISTTSFPPSSKIFTHKPMKIQGIRLVPEIPTTTVRTIWDLLQEQQLSASEENRGSDDSKINLYPLPQPLPFNMITKTPKPIFSNFDTDSAEEEYESENFQHGWSNIEKHELPFSYALPWLQIKDKQFDSHDDDNQIKAKYEEQEKDLVVPDSSRFAAISSDEELRIPADISRLLRLSDLPELGADVAVSVVQSGADSEPRGRTKWYLLLLIGNSTIVQKRRDDFTKYLRLNLAARLSVEYDDVKVNKLILAPPRVLVNVSVYEPSDDIAEESQLDLRDKMEEKGDGPLHKLAENNATLLELSGEEYRVVRFLSLQAEQPQAEAQRDFPKQTSLSARHEDIEFVIYTFLGSACACAVIVTLFMAFNKYLRKWKEIQWPWMRPKVQRTQLHEEEQEIQCVIPPAVIYSGGFPQIRGSWMGRPTQSEPPSVSSSSASLLQRYPGIEVTSNQPSSPRHNKLRMYNCGADRVLVRKMQDNNPLDVRIPAGQDNPTYTN